MAAGPMDPQFYARGRLYTWVWMVTATGLAAKRQLGRLRNICLFGAGTLLTFFAFTADLWILEAQRQREARRPRIVITPPNSLGP